jgi:hypothetical protein
MQQLDCLRAAAGDAFAEAARADDATVFARLQIRVAAARPTGAAGKAEWWRTFGDWLRAYALPVQGALATAVVALAVALAGTVTWRTSNPGVVRAGLRKVAVATRARARTGRA